MLNALSLALIIFISNTTNLYCQVSHENANAYHEQSITAFQTTNELKSQIVTEIDKPSINFNTTDLSVELL